MGARLRFKVFVVLVVAGLAATVLAVACGSDDGNGPGGCEGASCDGGWSESSTNDGASDTGVSDAGMDATDADADAVGPGCSGDGGDAGTLDPSFGEGGVTWESIGGSGVYSVVMQPDGKILLGGYVGGKIFTVVRLTPSGAPDTTFGDGGVVENSISFRSFGVSSVAVQPDGKIVATGSAALSANLDFVVVRYTSGGSLDPTFADAGIGSAPFGTDSLPSQVTVLSDGHILVTGMSGKPSSDAGTDYAAARFNADGTLDTTFADAGVVRTDIRSSEDRGGPMALQADGKFVIVGGSTQEPARLISDFSAVRYNANGSLDTTFGTGGKFVSSFGNADQQASGVVLDSTGRIILGGSSGGGANTAMALVRLTTTGVVDASFGSGGLVTTPFAGMNAYISRLLAQPDGKLLGVGGAYPTGGQSSIALARWQADGTLDATFGSGGKVVVGVSGFTNPAVNGAALTGCSDLLVGITLEVPSPPTTWMGVARYGL